MAGIALVGHIGDKEIVRDHFLPSNVHTTEWRGNASYEQAYYVQLPISANANDLASSLPRDLVKFAPAHQKTVDEIFELEKSYLRHYDHWQAEEVKSKAARDARQKEMDAALKDSSEERAKRKRAAEDERKKLEDEQERMITELRNLTTAAADKCKELLQKANWDISEAARLYYEQVDTSTAKQDVTIDFTVQSTGSRTTKRFKDSTTVFELYQTVFPILPDQTRGFEMFCNNRLLGEMEFGLSLNSIGLKAGSRHNIRIRQS